MVYLENQLNAHIVVHQQFIFIVLTNQDGEVGGAELGPHRIFQISLLKISKMFKDKIPKQLLRNFQPGNTGGAHPGVEEVGEEDVEEEDAGVGGRILVNYDKKCKEN